MLDGLNGYIDVGSNESFDMVSGKITISAWIKTTPSALTQIIVSKKSDGWKCRLSIQLAGKYNRLYVL